MGVCSFAVGVSADLNVGLVSVGSLLIVIAVLLGMKVRRAIWDEELKQFSDDWLPALAAGLDRAYGEFVKGRFEMPRNRRQWSERVPWPHGIPMPHGQTLAQWKPSTDEEQTALDFAQTIYAEGDGSFEDRSVLHGEDYRRFDRARKAMRRLCDGWGDRRWQWAGFAPFVRSDVFPDYRNVIKLLPYMQIALAKVLPNPSRGVNGIWRLGNNFLLDTNR